MTDDSKRYNGWSNYETWCVNLWLTNDEASERHWRGIAEELKGEPSLNRHWTDEEYRTFTLSDQLKEEITDSMPEVPGMWSDLLRSSLEEVDWHEIADAFLED
jgi:hypothetical protein